MEKKEEIITGRPVTIAGITIVPVSRITINATHSKRGITVYGSIHPDSIVVATPSAKIAFRTTGEEVSIDELLEEYPDIPEKLEEI